jgi:outer membrane protein TolC
MVRILSGGAGLLAFLCCTGRVSGQTAPDSYSRPWHAIAEEKIKADAKELRDSRFSVDTGKTYSLAELVDMAESHNPETRLAWERARAQVAVLGVAHSELYPILTAAATSGTRRQEVYLQDRFYRQTIQDFEAALELNYTVFDFGGRSGRINAAKAEVLAANFAFNDVHRQIIYQVEHAYYQLLNASGQEDAARASLSNAQAVQQAAEDRLNNGLATLPDVLEARSSTAQAEYELQAVLGAEQVAQGDLATSLGTSPTIAILVQPLKDLSIPDAIADSVEAGIDRALTQRPDLMQQVAQIRSANARVKEARSAFYPVMNINARPAGQSLYGMQQTFPWGHTAGLTGGLTFSLKWTCFFTALSTIGSSRQKQALRLSGFLVGGLVLGMGAQIFVLPYLDSIFGFTILFIVVTGLASWFATCSPRLSFFGLRIAISFYLIHLQEFAIQTSLAVARDRVVGVLLGLFIMWLVYAQLCASPPRLR